MAEEMNKAGVLAMDDEYSLSHMYALVARKFAAKFDKGGRPYFEHCYRVCIALAPYGFNAQIVGCGHDLIEDTDTTYSELLRMGFSDEVVEGIRCMTKIPGETKEEYQAKVMSNDLAILAKIEDTGDNSDLRRIKGVRQKDFDRHVGYMEFSHRLQAEAKARNLYAKYRVV